MQSAVRVSPGRDAISRDAPIFRARLGMFCARSPRRTLLTSKPQRLSLIRTHKALFWERQTGIHTSDASDRSTALAQALCTMRIHPLACARSSRSVATLCRYVPVKIDRERFESRL